MIFRLFLSLDVFGGLGIRLASAQASYLSYCRSSIEGDTSPVLYQPPYEGTTYIRDFSLCVDALQFSMLPQSGSALTIPIGLGLRDTAAATYRKRWKHWKGCGTSTLRKTCREMDFSFVRFGEENKYQHRLAVLFAEVLRRPTEPTIVATDLLCFREGLR